MWRFPITREIICMRKFVCIILKPHYSPRDIILIIHRKKYNNPIFIHSPIIDRVSLPGFPEGISRDFFGKFPSRIPGDFVPFSRDKREIFEVLNLHDFIISMVYFSISMLISPACQFQFWENWLIDNEKWEFPYPLWYLTVNCLKVQNVIPTNW